MARKRSLLGKSPGGKFRGIPGNPTNMLGWGGVFKRKGDWGILNPAEWTSLGSRQAFGNIGPRPQGQLQQIIDYNLGFGETIEQAAQVQGNAPKRGGGGSGAGRSNPSDSNIIKAPQLGFLNPGGGSSAGGRSGGGSTGGGTTGGGASSGAPAGGKGTSSGGGGGKSGGGKPAPISAAVKAMKNPVKRGR
jgi:hypothetical protein